MMALDTAPQALPVVVMPNYPLRRPWEQMAETLANLPFYDVLDRVPAVLWRLSYFKPYYEPLAPPGQEITIWPAYQAAYLLSSLEPLFVKKPYTRVRFDQSSRRTQLLSVDHAQNFSPRAGFQIAYRRRTRTGEYLGQTTDHYGVGLAAYGQSPPRPTSGLSLYGRIQTFWNQLLDELNGGSVFDPAQGIAGAFQKESQPVRFTDGQWRLWHRLVKAEGGLTWWGGRGGQVAMGLYGQVRQTYGGWRGGPARVPASPFGTDTAALSTFAFGEEQQVGVRMATHRAALSVGLLRWWGYGTGWQPFDKNAFTVESHLTCPAEGRPYTLRLHAFYRHWLSPRSPAPEVRSTLTFQGTRDLAPELFLQYSRMALPWFFYQAWGLPSPRNPEYALIKGGLAWQEAGEDRFQDSTAGAEREGLRLHGWALWQRWPLLVHQAQISQPEKPLLWYGVQLTGTWTWGHMEMYPAVLFQRPLRPDTLAWWTRQIPAVTGWVQVSYRWRIRPFIPVYRLGVRVRGSSLHQPPQYEPAYALFFTADATPYQPSWAAVDVFLTISLRQLRIYLRVDHVAEGLSQPGSFWAYPYPVPGRAFSFGFVWELYN